MSEPSQLQEIISRLRVIESHFEGGKTPVIPLIDPTANVLALVAAETKRQDDLREQAEKFRDKLDTERRRTETEAKKAEADRIDALLLANKNDVALALSKQQAQAEAQDKRIAIVEQNQYQGVGRQGQQVESRQRSEWVIGLLVTLALGAGALLMRLMK